MGKYVLCEIITDHPVLQTDGSIIRMEVKRVLSEKETKEKIMEFWGKEINKN